MPPLPPHDTDARNANVYDANTSDTEVRNTDVTPEQIKIVQNKLCRGEAISSRTFGELSRAMMAVCHLERAPSEDQLKNWCFHAKLQARPVISMPQFSDFVHENKMPSKHHRKRRETSEELTIGGRYPTFEQVIDAFNRVDGGE